MGPRRRPGIQKNRASGSDQSEILKLHGSTRHGEAGIEGETHLILGELEPRGDDDRQARVMIVFGGLHADKHVVEVRGVRCHGRRRHRRRHRRRFLADYPPRRRCFHYHASANFRGVHLLDPLQRRKKERKIGISKKKSPSISTIRDANVANCPAPIFIDSTIDISLWAYLYLYLYRGTFSLYVIHYTLYATETYAKVSPLIADDRHCV